MLPELAHSRGAGNLPTCGSSGVVCPRTDNAHIEAINSGFRSAIGRVASDIGAFGIGNTVACLNMGRRTELKEHPFESKIACLSDFVIGRRAACVRS